MPVAHVAALTTFSNLVFGRDSASMRLAYYDIILPGPSGILHAWAILVPHEKGCVTI